MFKNCSEYPASRLSLILASVTGAAVLLAACGGGGGGGGGTQQPKTQFTEVRDTVDDVLPPQQSSYALDAIGASRSGGQGYSRGQGVSVAVIDSEFDDGHPDLRDAFSRDANGWVIGRNVKEGHNDTRPVAQRFRTPRSDIVETSSAEDIEEARQHLDTAFARSISHGTHVAGIIAARNNRFGVVGVAPEANLVPVTIFRDFASTRYNRYGLSGLDSADLPEWNRHVAASVNYATSRNPFVINNSWGFSWFEHEIEVTGDRDLGTYHFRLPNFFLLTDVAARQTRHRDIFSADAVRAWEGAVANGSVVIFAAGNDGWNSVTGQHKVYRTPLLDGQGNHRAWTDYRGEEHFDYIETTSRLIRIDQITNASVQVPDNIPNLESSYFLTNDKLKGSWLAVVNVDKGNIIYRSSNGCGIAKDYCLAAPGTNVLSTVVRGDKDDVEDGSLSRVNKQLTGDSDLHTGDGTSTYTGTSMAAPMVSGALALIKSQDPVLTAEQAVKILLCTATDLDKSSGRPAKSVQECSDRGPEAIHANGWSPSDVYGHGLVNLTRALAPIGQVAAAGQNAQRVADPGRSRIAFSAAFGDAAPSMALNFGGLDSFGRVYKFHAPLQDRVLPGPQLAGVMARSSAAFSAQPPTRIGDSGAGASTLLQTSTTPDSAIGDGSRISFVTARNLTTLTLARRQTSSQLSPSNLMMDGVYSGPSSAGPSSAGVSSAGPSNAVQPGTGHAVWASFAPQARNVVRMETGWSLASHVVAGAYASSAKAMHATRRAEGYRIRDFGTHAHFDDGVSAVHMRIGQMHENGRFLGSKSEGAYALNRPTRSNYLHVSARRQLRPGLTIGANLMRLRSHVDFRHNAFVADTQLTAQSAGAYLSLADMTRPGHRLTLHHGAPLAVTSGTIRQTSVAGYTDDGVYRTDSTDVALGVTARHRMTQIVYQAPLAKHIHGFAALARHDNWSHRRGLDNNLLMLGLTMKR